MRKAHFVIQPVPFITWTILLTWGVNWKKWAVTVLQLKTWLDFSRRILLQNWLKRWFPKLIFLFIFTHTQLPALPVCASIKQQKTAFLQLILLFLHSRRAPVIHQLKVWWRHLKIPNLIPAWILLLYRKLAFTFMKYEKNIISLKVNLPV